MRTKKTNIKNGKVTRTIQFTHVKFLTVDIETREVKEESQILVLEYDKVEAENALRELGFNVAAVVDVETFEQKYSISYEKMVAFGDAEA